MPRDRRRHGEPSKPAAATSWDALATWYDGWVGEGGSEHHRQIAVPAILRILDPQPFEQILDVGCGQGVLAPPITQAEARYTGVDASPRLVALARQHHGRLGRFLVGDARDLAAIPELRQARFDAAVFLLSLQDMDPLDRVLGSVARSLKPGGRVAILLTHPAFRVPRQSGWGWDEKRKLIYRRVDRYLTPLAVPMKAYPGRDNKATTRSFHRPIEAYVNGLADQCMLVDRFDEIPGPKGPAFGASARAERLASQEIPLFLALRGRQVAPNPL
mgnify:CR=1 FL=1